MQKTSVMHMCLLPTVVHTGHGFFTHDLALKLESGGYRITGRENNAIRIQGVWLDVASIEDQMVGAWLLHRWRVSYMLYRTDVMTGF